MKRHDTDPHAWWYGRGNPRGPSYPDFNKHFRERGCNQWNEPLKKDIPMQESQKTYAEKLEPVTLSSSEFFQKRNGKPNYRCERTLRGHNGKIRGITILLDGNIVSGAWDSTLMMWNINTGKCLKIMEGHTSSVRCVATLPNGNIVSGSKDKTLKVWDLDKFVGSECVQTLDGHDDEVRCVAAHPNNDNIIISGSGDKTLKVWDINTRKCLKVMKGHTEAITSILVLSNNTLVSSSGDKTLRVWNINTGKCLKVMEGHIRSVNSVTKLPNGNVVSGSLDRTLRVWDIDTGKCINTINTLHQRTIKYVVALPNGNVITGSYDNTLKVWDIKNKECLDTMVYGSNAIILCVTVLPGGDIISGSSDNTLKIWKDSNSLDNQLQFTQGNNQLVEEEKSKLIFTVLDEKNWGELKNKEISGHMFRFFDSKTSKSFGCLSKAHKNLQYEIDQEMSSINSSLKK